ncbi:MAG: hypothetical protein ACJ73S_07860 [Mycobacteriales bacterium]
MDPTDLTGPERALWQAFPRGGLVDLRTGDPDTDDPANAAGWGEDRAVRAEVIAALLRGAVPAEPGHTAALRLAGARVDGPLDLRHTDIPYPLWLPGCALVDQVSLRNVRLRSLNLEGSCLAAGMDTTLAVIDGNLRMAGCRCAGLVRLTGTRIRGALLLQEAQLANPDGIALLANRLVVEDDALCQGLSAVGNVRLAGARIGGMLSLDGAHLADPRGRAFTGFNLTVGARLSARHGFAVDGEMVLVRATVGEVDLSSAQLRNPGGNALLADGLTVAGALHLADGFTATGTVRLTRARIGGPVNLEGARLTGPAGGPALACRHADAGELRLRPAEPVEGAVDLRHARFELIQDDPATWPDALIADGLEYRALEPSLPARRRLDWLRRDPDGYVPRAYEQLAATYRTLGDDAGARTVLLAKQRHRRERLPWYTRTWGWFQEVTVGYGYRPLRAAGWFVLLAVLGTASFGHHHPPPVPDTTPPAFNPLVYTLDLLLPVIDLGQEHGYDPRGDQRWLAYLLILTGWLLASTIAAGVIRVLRRD